jgi:hypothetical protein
MTAPVEAHRLTKRYGTLTAVEGLELGGVLLRRRDIL